MIKRVSFGDAVPDSTRPLRVTVNTILPELSDPRLACEPLVIAWFERIPPGPAEVIAAEEVVLRGADWLNQRWQDDGPKFKHLALAQRAEGLTQDEFSARWRQHAGSASGKIIPDVARGQAYVQNHPITAGRYDALTEVYFDDLAGLRARVEWFRANPVTDPLFRSSWFLAVREEVSAPR